MQRRDYRGFELMNETDCRAARSPDRQDFAILNRPYLMVTFIPVYKDEDGGLWLEHSWHHDLTQHLNYLTDFRLCAPVLPKDNQPGLVRLDLPQDGRLRVLPLPAQSSKLAALRSLPKVVSALWRAIGDAELVHCGVIGWPYPLGWIANPIAVLRGKALLVVIESSWLRNNPEPKEPWRFALLNAVSNSVAHWSCKHADVAFYTHSAYRDTLHVGDPATGYVTPAIWINDEDILDDVAARRLWSRKVSEPVRLLLAGRLIADKGIDVLLAALRLLEQRGVKVQVDIIGVGERRNACLKAAEELHAVSLSVLDPVSYGEAFFKLVQRYHAVLIPNLTDEQPRILFDASAQAVPAIASDTAGLRPHIVHDRSGWLVPPGDPTALASVIERASSQAPKLGIMGMGALSSVRGNSHAEMHRLRSHILVKHFGSSSVR